MDVCVHDHVAWWANGPEALARLAQNALVAAARQGQRMLWIGRNPDPSQLSGIENLDELIEDGALQTATVEQIYADIGDPAGQRASFEQTLDAALADGYTGICVLADNTSLACGDDEQFATWLTWEATADWMQSVRPITGICVFDGTAVPAQRLADLAATHPVRSGGFEDPAFQIYFDNGAVCASGEMDGFGAAQLGRLLACLPKHDQAVLDLSRVEFIDHRALLALEDAARQGHIRGARAARPMAHKIWALLDVRQPSLELC